MTRFVVPEGGMRVLAAFAAFVLALALPGHALAQKPDVRASADVSEVEIGDTLSYSLHATSETGEAPSRPDLGPHPGFTIVDRGSSPTHMVSIVNGRRSERHGLTTTWTLQATKIGPMQIGPSTIVVGGITTSAAPVRVTVVAKGKGTRKPPRARDPWGQPSPLDPWKSFFDWDEPRDPVGGVAATNHELALAEPRAPVAFLHARIDKTRAVVGEQVTLSVYLYEDPHARQGQPSDVHEANATDFVKRSLQQDETRAVGMGAAMVGGRPWTVKLVRRNALFPLKTGRLTIGPMSLALPQVRVGVRESETLAVDVTEPPVAGRPPGYQLGDVGDFALTTTVAPRAVTQEDAIGVTVELRGTGNIPQKLPLPEVRGVEWLETETKDQLGAVREDRFGGTRTFTYVVRLHEAGAIDLGEIRLPFFDPDAHAYGVARAGLGIVNVAKGTPKDAGIEIAPPPLPALPSARHTLEGAQPETFITERSWFWGGVLGAPLAAVLAVSFQGLGRRLRDRRANAAPSPKKLARDARARAEAAISETDGGAALAAVTSATEAEVLARTSVNVRGTSRDGAQRELEDAGVAPDIAREVLDVLASCEDARFSPSGVSVARAKELWSRARNAIDALGGS